MQDLGNTDPLISSDQRIPYKFDDYLLQPFDIVEINIKTTSPELNELFSVITGDISSNMGMMGGQGGGDVFFMNGYTLEENGVVELPLIGEIKLVGLTTKEAKEMIENEVSRYVNENEYFVRVRLGGIRFSTLGEFNSPGKHTVLQNRVTIFEAIATAGDMNVIAKRNEVTLVRQYPNGSQIHKINLNDKNLLSSEFYFIRPNDLIYAEPLKVREVGSGMTFIQSLTLVTSTLTAFALIFTFLN
ncbi:polysaccharide biosynthesis/export family protein [Algoriphagus hitonicola]|nr:polysaccharide biosynthesis/export family protein [Algoriphagus hitonicola]